MRAIPVEPGERIQVAAALVSVDREALVRAQAGDLAAALVGRAIADRQARRARVGAI